MLYCRLIYMLSILCVIHTIKVKLGIPESFKVGWYPLKKTGSSHLNSIPQVNFWHKHFPSNIFPPLFCLVPSHSRSPLAVYARSLHPSLTLLACLSRLVSRAPEFPNLHLALRKPVEEAVPY